MNNDVDVIILNWHDEKRTKECLKSLQDQREIRTIYVVDNETDGTLILDEFMTNMDVVLLESIENRGFAGGVNLAMAHRKNDNRIGPILALNNDVILPKNAIFSLRQAAIDGVGAVGPVLVYPDGKIQAAGHVISRLTGIARPRLNLNKRFDYVTWACVLITQSAQDAIGLLDERFFMYWEDADYGVRLKREGFVSLIIPTVEVVHELSASNHKAGTLLREYYAWSLKAFGIKNRSYWLKSRIAFGLLVIKRSILFDIAGINAICRGWKRPISSQAFHLKEETEND